uniref:Uncharacterized protein n=1 Tax=Anguilla anguilla TaxID=7936 RepID=A0A0E9R7X2_ANGAN
MFCTGTCVDVSKCDERRRSCPVATDFYSKPLKGQHVSLEIEMPPVVHFNISADNILVDF